MWRLTASQTLLLAVVLAGVTAPATSSPQSTWLTDLGLGNGQGLNDSGQVVFLTSSGGVQSAQLYSNGVITPLPLTENLAINASGAVAGTNSAGHAAVYSDGVVTDLGLLPGSDSGVGPYTNATAINSSGEVVGQASPDGAGVYAFSYSNGAMVNIGYLPGAVTPGTFFSTAFGVNDSGQITGFSYGPDGLCHGFLYQNYAMTDLGLGTGLAINAGGEITGVLSTPQLAANGCPPGGHAFLYANGTISDLGVLPGGSGSYGVAINASGQIVGGAGTAAGTTHGMFYNGAMTDLNALIDPADPLKPYVTLTEAMGINVNRIILANGVDSRTPTLQHVYLLQGPWLDFAPGPLSFAKQPIGTVSPAQTVTIRNSGTSTVTLGTPSVSGDFSQSNHCSATLAASSSCEIFVTFSPTSAGNLTGTLTVVSGGLPSTVALAGIAPISVSLTTSAPSVAAGSPFTLTWTVSSGASCTTTGGSAADGWGGELSGTGSHSVTEANPGDYLYGLSCTAGQQTGQAQAKVVVNNDPNIPNAPTNSSGGGALGLETLIALFGLGAMRAWRPWRRAERQQAVGA
jgi:probable HAF family extracellular repeat protein